VVNAVVLLNIEQAHVNNVAQQITTMPGVTDVYSVAGEYDVVVILRVNDNEAVADLVTKRVAHLPGIRNTETLIAFRTYSNRDLDAGFSLGDP
jgi:DNA-binding Lrp family transcriptional regulator